jgi:hypothetical protein
MTTPRPWSGISTGDWFINSDTPQSGLVGDAKHDGCVTVRGMSGRHHGPDVAETTGDEQPTAAHRGP